MTKRINVPPMSEKPTDQSGLISRIWHRFFVDLQKAVNTSSDANIEGLLSGAGEGGGADLGATVFEGTSEKPGLTDTEATHLFGGEVTGHGATHTDGTDDIQNATNVIKGLMTSALVTEVEVNTTKVTNATHTGEVTGATALTIVSDAVTYDKMQDVSATDKILGRSTAGAGTIEEIACISSARVFLAEHKLGAELDAQAHTIGFTQQSATGDGTTTIDWKLGNKFEFTWGAQANTFTFTAPSNPCSLLLKMIQDGTGGRDATWPASVKWLGTEPIWTDGAAGKVIIVSFYYDGTTYWAQGSPWEV